MSKTSSDNLIYTKKSVYELADKKMMQSYALNNDNLFAKIM